MFKVQEDVRDYGAAGDGVSLDTKAIQAAIDACTAKGGGVVLLPAGQYLTGKLWLKENVTVNISEGAVVLASEKMSDYPESDGPPNTTLKRRKEIRSENPGKRWAVFYACGVNNISIVGKGRVDGQYKKVVPPMSVDKAPDWVNCHSGLKMYKPDGFRHIIVFFEECNNITMDGVDYVDSPFYTTAFRRCNNIKIRNVRIDNSLGMGNSDGLHFHSCCDVFVSDCYIHTGDDSIAIDSNEGGMPSKGYVIQNCILASKNNCIRIYTCLGTNAQRRKTMPYGYVSDISITNCVVNEGDSFLYINADMGTIERIAVSNVSGTMTRYGTAFLMTAHNRSKIKNVVMSNFSLSCRGVGYIYGDEKKSIQNISLNGLKFQVSPKTKLYGNGFDMPRIAAGTPIYWLSHYAPYFLQIKNAAEIGLNDVRIDWENPEIDDIEQIGSEYGEQFISEAVSSHGWPVPKKGTPNWPAVSVEDTEGFSAANLVCSPFGNEKSAVELTNVKKINFLNCRDKEGNVEGFFTIKKK